MNEGGRGEGQLYSVHDSKTGLTYQYSYDSQGRLMSSSVTDVSDPNNPVKVITTRQTYDANNQLSGQHWKIGTTNYSESYTYSKTTGLLATHTPAVGNTLSYGYDDLQRLTSVIGGISEKTYVYDDHPVTDNGTTTRVAQLKYNLPSVLSYIYDYDANGNIITYIENGKLYRYTYDAQNQLTSRTGPGIEYAYTYDVAGNILTASDGTDTHNYTYGNAIWKDLLTAYDGQTITYDDSGNPTSYYNGTHWTMTWAEGRRLASASGDGKNLTFTYDSDGLRLTKKVGSTTYNYYYAGGKLLRQTGGENTLDFFYDASGNPYALKYNNTLYYYITNLQGDVLHIVNTSGTPVVSYSYSPYGEIENVTGDLATSLGVHNPLRYRGYVYDEETDLYYLQSRYYDPATCRFINADEYASTGQGVLGCNMFAYCNNSPSNSIDTSGHNPLHLMQKQMEGGGGGGAGIIVAGGITLLGYSIKAILSFAADSISKLAREVYEYSQEVKMELAEVKKKLPHVHHIVPVGNFSNRSETARRQIEEIHSVLKDVDINRWLDPANLMLVSAGHHASLHTDAYIAHVHSYIMPAAGNQEAVYAALFALRIEIAFLDQYSPGY